MGDGEWGNDGWTDDEEFSGLDGEGIWSKLTGWMSGGSRRHEEDEATSFDEAVEAARRRVEDYHSSNKAAEHWLRMEDSSYRASAEYRIASEIEHLERHLARYDEECTRSGPDALLSQELWEKRIAGLNQAIAEAERALAESKQSYDTLEDRWQRGSISRAEYDDLHRKLGKKEQRDGTRLELSGLGGSFEEIGDVGDQAGHILEDSLANDDGETRQKISKKIRSMPRWMALQILEQAVADGVITQQTAKYLIREYVRPS